MKLLATPSMDRTPENTFTYGKNASTNQSRITMVGMLFTDIKNNKNYF